MIIELDMNSSTPIYVQLRNQIVMGIGRGELKLGESLPTVRQLAQDIGVNTMTVNKAYQILKTEGYIKIDSELMDNTIFLKESLKKIGYNLVVEPELNIVSFNHPNIDAYELSRLLDNKGWKVSVSSCPIAIRIVLMSHVKKSHLEEFLEDLKELF